MIERKCVFSLPTTFFAKFKKGVNRRRFFVKVDRRDKTRENLFFLLLLLLGNKKMEFSIKGLDWIRFDPKQDWTLSHLVSLWV